MQPVTMAMLYDVSIIELQSGERGVADAHCSWSSLFWYKNDEQNWCFSADNTSALLTASASLVRTHCLTQFAHVPRSYREFFSARECNTCFFHTLRETRRLTGVSRVGLRFRKCPAGRGISHGCYRDESHHDSKFMSRLYATNIVGRERGWRWT